MINKERIIDLTQRLVRAKSENPPGDEYKSAMIVKKELEKLGLIVNIYEFEKKRPNVIGILKGADTTKKSLLITPHLDVVPAGKGWKKHPFSAEYINGKIYGRGTSDCKGHVAICIEVVKSILENNQKLNGDLIFAATVDEETGSRYGLIPLLEKGILKPTNAIAIDDGDFKIISAQKGVMHLTIKIMGKKAHGAYPHKGINAIEIAAKIIVDLKTHKFKYKKHNLFEKPTINIGKINGGQKVNIVADSCIFELDLRFLPGMNKERILTDIKTIINNYSDESKIIIDMDQEPYEIDSEHKIIQKLKQSFKKYNIPANIVGSSGATVISLFKKHNIPSIATGFSVGDLMHATDEYVIVDDLVVGAKILEDFIINFFEKKDEKNTKKDI
ncbi:ArgE/DapE family deacylase [archaeon]|nr:ArgE/DapE family deacylase [archaeon]